MKYSRQREAIYRVVRQSCQHPTADAVYEQVRAENPQISLGTVYRNLNQLTEAGQLLKIAMPWGSDRFDGRLDEHYHMICTGCGKVADVDHLALSNLDSDILNSTGFRVTRHHMVLDALCRDCDNGYTQQFERRDS